MIRYLSDYKLSELQLTLKFRSKVIFRSFSIKCYSFNTWQNPCWCHIEPKGSSAIFAFEIWVFRTFLKREHDHRYTFLSQIHMQAVSEEWEKGTHRSIKLSWTVICPLFWIIKKVLPYIIFCGSIWNLFRYPLTPKSSYSNCNLHAI